MGKKKGLAIPIIYLIGMVFACVGCFLPLYSAKVFKQIDGISIWGLMTQDNAKALTIVLCVSVLLLIVAGIVFCFVKIKGVSGLLRLIAAAGSLVAFLSIFISKIVANTPKNDTARKAVGKIAKATAKAINIVPHVGFYFVLAGLIVAIVGWFLCKED